MYSTLTITDVAAPRNLALMAADTECGLYVSTISNQLDMYNELSAKRMVKEVPTTLPGVVLFRTTAYGRMIYTMPKRPKESRSFIAALEVASATTEELAG